MVNFQKLYLVAELRETGSCNQAYVPGSDYTYIFHDIPVSFDHYPRLAMLILIIQG